jgi:hypothetical protein
VLDELARGDADNVRQLSSGDGMPKDETTLQITVQSAALSVGDFPGGLAKATMSMLTN